MEAKTQQRLIKFLKGQGCEVFKMTIMPGIPKGTPDILFLKEGFWGFAEVKASAKAPFQTLQPEKIAKFNEWSWCKAVYPENYDEVIEELEQIL